MPFLGGFRRNSLFPDLTVSVLSAPRGATRGERCLGAKESRR
jgi:hypothetical protein